VDDITAIRDRRLYRRDFATFADYCRDRWGMSRTHADRMISAAEVVDGMTPMGVTGELLPASERQARELSGLALSGVQNRTPDEAPPADPPPTTGLDGNETSRRREVSGNWRATHPATRHVSYAHGR
jgi:hypothetical protein